MIPHWWTIRIDDKMWTDEQEDGGSVHSAWADELVRIFREGQLEFRGHCANFMRFPSPGLPSPPSPPPNNPVHPPLGVTGQSAISLELSKTKRESSWCWQKCARQPPGNLLLVWWLNGSSCATLTSANSAAITTSTSTDSAASVMTEWLSGNICIVGTQVSQYPGE